MVLTHAVQPDFEIFDFNYVLSSEYKARYIMNRKDINAHLRKLRQ